jgi:hypothetical protein
LSPAKFKVGMQLEVELRSGRTFKATVILVQDVGDGMAYRVKIDCELWIKLDDLS